MTMTPDVSAHDFALMTGSSDLYNEYSCRCGSRMLVCVDADPGDTMVEYRFIAGATEHGCPGTIDLPDQL